MVYEGYRWVVMIWLETNMMTIVNNYVNRRATSEYLQLTKCNSTRAAAVSRSATAYLWALDSRLRPWPSRRHAGPHWIEIKGLHIGIGRHWQRIACTQSRKDTSMPWESFTQLRCWYHCHLRCSPRRSLDMPEDSQAWEKTCRLAQHNGLATNRVKQRREISG